MSNRYHINPETGRAGVCSAKIKCKFNLSEDQHYATKEEARKAFEKARSSETLPATSRKIPAIGLTDNAKREILESRLKIVTAERQACYEWVRGPEGSTIILKSTKSRSEFKKWLAEEKKILAKLDEIAIKERAKNPAPEFTYEDFPQTFGLQDSRGTVLNKLNSIGKFSEDDEPFFHKDLEYNIQETLNRYHNGERIIGPQKINLASDRLLRVLSSEDNGLASHGEMYAIMIFPEKDLKPVLERLSVENVSVSPLTNGRENGLVYTVIDPEGNTRSFSVYEHRNTDSIVINGATNWDPVSQPYGPYGDEDSGRTKYTFFAEQTSDNFKQTAETLGFFLKEAQNGELPDDETLVRNASHLDWSAIISETIPGFKDWVKENFPEKDQDRRPDGFDELFK